MVRNDDKKQASTTTTGFVDGSEATSLHTVGQLMLRGAAITYAVCLVVLGFAIGWAFAPLVALWPAAFVGPMLGGLVALARRTDEEPVADVVPIVPSGRATGRDAA